MHRQISAKRKFYCTGLSTVGCATFYNSTKPNPTSYSHGSEKEENNSNLKIEIEKKNGKGVMNMLPLHKIWR